MCLTPELRACWGPAYNLWGRCLLPAASVRTILQYTSWCQNAYANMESSNTFFVKNNNGEKIGCVPRITPVLQITQGSFSPDTNEQF